MSELERAQEWLNCQRYVPSWGGESDAYCTEHGPFGWPCSDANYLASFLIETRAAECSELLAIAGTRSTVAPYLTRRILAHRDAASDYRRAASGVDDEKA